MLVKVDDREDRDTILALETVVDVEICHLEVGDFQVGEYIIEHKKPDDYWASLTEPGERLYRQLDKMKQTCKQGNYALVYSGDPEFLLSTNPGAASVASCFVRGCPILFCHDLDGMAKVTKYLFEKWTDGRDRSYNPNLNARYYKDSSMCVITGIPFVQEELGNRLLVHFGSMRGVSCASIEELQEVKGVGEKIAREIFDALNRPRW